MAKKNITSQFDNENALIDGLIAGDTGAFEYVVSAYHNLMLSVARAIVGESIADEVTQDAWLSALKAIGRFERRSSLKTWLLHIVSNAAKSRLKREKRYVSLEYDSQSQQEDQFDQSGHRIDVILPWEHTTPESLLENEQLQTVIEHTFQTLPPVQRATMRMVDIEGVAMKEVCNILSLTPSNARVLLHRARVAVHAAIAEYQGK